jgi:integrase
VIGPRWVDVDLDARCLFIVQQITEVRGKAVVGSPKTKRGTRAVPIDDDTVAMLRRHREGQAVERMAWGSAWNEAGLVFTRENGLPLRPEYATRHFQRLAREAGLPRLRLHDLRHTNASLALQAGVNPKVVSDRLGHSQISSPPTFTPTSTSPWDGRPPTRSRGRWARDQRRPTLWSPASRGLSLRRP